MRRIVVPRPALVAIVSLALTGCPVEDDLRSPAVETTFVPAAVCTSGIVLSYHAPDEAVLKDFALVHDGDRFHLFATRAATVWPSGTEIEFQHASSVDLVDWTTHDPIDLRRPVVAETEIWAPHVVHHEGHWWMFYTGVVYVRGEQMHNVQRIVSAVSDDLHTWHPTSMVIEGDPTFSSWGTARPWGDDLRDPMLWAHEDGWLLFATVRMHDERQAIAVASSSDLQEWTWMGPLEVTAGTVAESPSLAHYRERHWLIWTARNGLRAASAVAPEGPYRPEELEVPGFAAESLGLADGSLLLGRSRQHAIGFVRLLPDEAVPPLVSIAVSPLCFEDPLLVPGPTVRPIRGLPRRGNRG